MDSNHFDRFSRVFASGGSRRTALGALAPLGLGGLAWRSADAKHKHKHHHKKHHHKPKPFCEGRNTCLDGSSCSDTASCGCFVTADGGKPFCGIANFADCSECAEGETCVDLSGGMCQGTTGCATPCPDPN